MLDTLPYADLLAIHNALADKPARRFDTRANGERRTAALMEERGLTLEEAARLADVVLSDGGRTDDMPPADGDAESEASTPNIADTAQGPAEPPPTPTDQAVVTIVVDAAIDQTVQAFVTELLNPERPAYLATFLRRLNGGTTRPSGVSAPGERQMTPSQHKIVELCSRPEGATGKELAEGCGWPSIAARATCQKLADRFGYTLEENPKANGRGISFRMVAIPAAEA